jgi:excisionase family DNA binding protein
MKVKRNNSVKLSQVLNYIKKEFTIGDRPLTTEEAAKFLGISMSQLYKLTSSGVIPHHKPQGKLMYFFKEDLIAFIKGTKEKEGLEKGLEEADFIRKKIARKK